MKIFIIASFSLCPINICSLQIAFSWLLAFLQVLEMCFPKFSLLSISIPNNLTHDFLVNSMPFLFNTDLLRPFLELIIIDWNLSGFTIILFVLNQFIAVSHYFRNIPKSSVKSLPTYIVLSSAKFASSASSIKKNKSFIKRLNRTGPRIDPWVLLIKGFERNFPYHLF